MKIEFTASLPPIQSAILLDGQGDGARIKLDIPRSHIKEILKLQALAGQSFKVIIFSIEQDENHLEEFNL